MESGLLETQGLRVAVEGCGHGTLNAIYEAVKVASEARGWDGVDLLIIGGDFQAVRNANDLTVMSCPVKYHAIGDFHAYYSGSVTAPYLTIFVGGNHEASSHMWELYYGGWAAPNIYYMGAANVVRLGGIRIAGMSGIWKGYNYNKPHYERLPYNQDDIKSIYHIRELDVRKLLQLQTQVDISISHDWPKAVEKYGNFKALFRAKDMFEKESNDGTLGSTAAAYVMDRLRPPYWFAAHMHIKFGATKIYEDRERPPGNFASTTNGSVNRHGQNDLLTAASVVNGSNAAHNEDEIDLDMDDETPPPKPAVSTVGGLLPATTNQDEISLSDEEDKPTNASELSGANPVVPDDIRSQLPAAFSRPRLPRLPPGQPVPTRITNKTVRFLALDKCLPGRKFLQLLEVKSYTPLDPSVEIQYQDGQSKHKLEYDPEWLAITRAFAEDLVLGEKNAPLAPDLGEDRYKERIETELEWVKHNVVQPGKLLIPENFELTAPPYAVGTPEIVNDGPMEYNNPQTQQFCDLIGIENKFSATEEERTERMRAGPSEAENRFDTRRGGRGGRGNGFGGERGRGWRGGGRRGSGGSGRGRGSRGRP